MPRTVPGSNADDSASADSRLSSSMVEPLSNGLEDTPPLEEILSGQPLSRAEPVLTRHRKPLPALTGLRFFAAFYVVMVHTRVGSTLLDRGHWIVGNFIANGFLAVPLFFILSGFILAYTYRGQIKSPLDRAHFWQARFARVWPAYVFSLLCASLPGFTIPPPGLALATLCMVQAWNPFHPEFAGAWNLVCWTLSAEALFYLCFPWLQLGLERLGPRRLPLVGLASLLLCVFANTGIRSLGSPVYAPPFQYLPLPLIHLPDFVVGVILGNLFLDLGSRSEESRLPFALLTTAGLVWCLVALCLPIGRFTSAVFPGFALLVFGLAAESSALARLLSTRALLLGGGISYSVYLLQTPVRVWIREVPALNHGNGVLTLLYVPVTLLLFATVVFFLIEEPARRLLRRLFARSFPGQPRRSSA